MNFTVEFNDHDTTMIKYRAALMHVSAESYIQKAVLKVLEDAENGKDLQSSRGMNYTGDDVIRLMGLK